MEKIKKIGKKLYFFINFNGKKIRFLINKKIEIYIDNILATLAVISIFFNLENLGENFFLNNKTLEGRGDHNYIKIKNKRVNLIDESYNSNPASFKFALEKFDNTYKYNKQKFILGGNMLELGK